MFELTKFYSVRINTYLNSPVSWKTRTENVATNSKHHNTLTAICREETIFGTPCRELESARSLISSTNVKINQEIETQNS